VGRTLSSTRSTGAPCWRRVAAVLVAGRTHPDPARARSALGPHGIGNRWSSAGTNGHDGQAEIAGHRTPTPSTSGRRAQDGGFESHLPAAAPRLRLPRPFGACPRERGRPGRASPARTVMPNGSALRGPPGRAGAAKHQIQPDSHGHERTLNPQVGPTAPWLFDASKLAYNDEVTGSSPVTPTDQHRRSARRAQPVSGARRRRSTAPPPCAAGRDAGGRRRRPALAVALLRGHDRDAAARHPPPVPRSQPPLGGRGPPYRRAVLADEPAPGQPASTSRPSPGRGVRSAIVSGDPVRHG
jgi:hypothetical protein